MQSSYAAGETDIPLLEETIGANFEATARAYADREALVEVASRRRWTWKQLDDAVNWLARGLLAAGSGLAGLGAGRVRAPVGGRRLARRGRLLLLRLL